MSKEIIINSIAVRIEAEHNKYSNLEDWERITAIKIYADYIDPLVIENARLEKIVETIYHCQYEKDNTTAMNCIRCGRPKRLHQI